MASVVGSTIHEFAGKIADKKKLLKISPDSLHSTPFKSYNILGLNSCRIVNVHVLINSPLFTLTPHLLTHEECAEIISLANDQGWKPSCTSSGLSNQKPSEYVPTDSRRRTSMSSCLEYFPPAQTLVAKILHRLANVFTCSINHFEAFTVLKYEDDQKFMLHHDGHFRPKSIVIYLNDVEDGGETIFPELNIAIKPCAGLAVCWSNCLPNNKKDDRVVHAALPSRSCPKYCIALFINTRIDNEMG